MPYSDRLTILQALQDYRGTVPIVLITSDRPVTHQFPGITANFSYDQIAVVAKHIRKLGLNDEETTAIDLIIHCCGGDVNSAWPLVNILRAHCQSLNVLPATRAHSAATLVSLGADSVVMSPFSELSPIDPTVSNAFNPRDEDGRRPLGISVEDVSAYFRLAEHGTSDPNGGTPEEDDNVVGFSELVGNVHPLALGNVQRSHMQIRALAQKMLGLHKTDSDDEHASKSQILIDNLTTELYTHMHYIHYAEAQSLGLWTATEADETTVELLDELHASYRDDLDLDVIFDPNVILGGDDERELETCVAMIESTALASSYRYQQRLKRMPPSDPAMRANLQHGRAQHALAILQQKASIAGNLTQLTQMAAQFQHQNQNVPQHITETFNSLNDLLQQADTIVDTIDEALVSTTIESKPIAVGWEHDEPDVNQEVGE